MIEHEPLATLDNGLEVVRVKRNPPTHSARRCECTRACDRLLWGRDWAVKSGDRLFSLRCAVERKVTSWAALEEVNGKLYPKQGQTPQETMREEVSHEVDKEVLESLDAEAPESPVEPEQGQEDPSVGRISSASAVDLLRALRM